MEKPRVFILSLKFDSELEAALTAFRTEYFPPERNFLKAHVTLFHALPEGQEFRWRGDLAEICAAREPFELSFGEVMSLGRGFAIRVQSAELTEVRRDLVSRWSDFLGPQDLQNKPHFHCAIQNKVDGPAARDSMNKFSLAWTPRRATALGVQVWRYLGGPWGFEFEEKFASKSSIT